METKYVLAIRSTTAKGMVSPYLQNFNNLEISNTKFDSPEAAAEYADEHFDKNFKSRLMIIPVTVFTN